MSIKIIPVIVLSGIDINKIYNNFINNIFPNYENLKPIKMKNNDPIIAVKYEKDNSKPIFTINDKTNNDILILTTNHNQYIMMTKEKSLNNYIGRCECCGYEFKGESIGIPISYNEINAEFLNPQGEKIHSIFYLFNCCRRTCSFECSLLLIENDHSRKIVNQTPLYQNSENNLRTLFKLMNPECNYNELKSAQDCSLLKINGGQLTREEWLSNKHQYVKNNRVILLPVKEEYFNVEY